jgi:hypothetical protein
MNWRSPKLLNRIKEASKAGDTPCFWPLPHACYQHKPGSVVYAHSNQLNDGKGGAMKAHDYRIALLCSMAHQECDQGNAFVKAAKFAAWDEAHRKTIGWLIEQGILQVR